MREDEINDQRNRYGRLVTFSDQFYIAPLNYEIRAFESMWRYSLQRQKWLEKILTEIYAVNRNLRERPYSGVETSRTQPGSQSTTNDSTHPSIIRLPNIKDCGERLEDIIAFLNKYNNGTNSTKQPAGSHQPDVGHPSLDPVSHQVVRDQVVK